MRCQLIRSRGILSVAAAALLVLAGAGAVQAADPTGLWEPDNRESRYRFVYCGETGTELCAQLVWIQEDKKDARNTKYLGRYMFTNARQIERDVWRGSVALEGLPVRGTLRQSAPDSMALKACAVLLFCETIHLNRVE